MVKRIAVVLLAVMTILTGCISSTSSPEIKPVSFDYLKGDKQWDEKYKDEPYVFLLSDNLMSVQKDLTYTETIHLVIRIQKEEGKKMGEFPLPYDSSRQEIRNIRAVNITPDGGKHPCSLIHDLQPYEGFATYTDSKVKILSFPNVVLGSILDIKVTLVHKRPVVKGQFFEYFYLTAPYPVKHVRKILSVPNGLDLPFKYRNTDQQPIVRQAEENTMYTWEASLKERIELEEYMPHPDDLGERISFSTIQTWEALSRDCYILFQESINLSDKLKKTVTRIVSDKQRTEDKIQAILEYIHDTFRYVSLNIDFHNYQPHDTDRVLYNKYGDCKDQTALAMAMLKAIDVESFPVLMSTELDLESREGLTPMLNYFDHAILAIQFKGKLYFTDVLSGASEFQTLSQRLANTNVLILKPENGGFVKLGRGAEEMQTTSFFHSVRLDRQGSATGKAKITLDNQTSEFFRKGLKDISPKEREKWLAGYSAQILPGAKILSADISNLEDRYTSLNLLFSYTHEKWAESVGDMMLFGVGAVDRTGSFTAPERHNPIVIRKGSGHVITCEYTLPDGYEIAKMPKNISFQKEYADFKRTYTRKAPNQVVEKTIFKDRPCRLEAEKYDEIKDFFDTLPILTKDRIVIRRKN